MRRFCRAAEPWMTDRSGVSAYALTPAVRHSELGHDVTRAFADGSSESGPASETGRTDGSIGGPEQADGGSSRTP